MKWKRPIHEIDPIIQVRLHLATRAAIVIPAKAGMMRANQRWIPTFTGMMQDLGVKQEPRSLMTDRAFLTELVVSQ